MIAIGIDPGTALTGVAVLRLGDKKAIPEILEVTCIKTLPTVEMHDRLHQMHDALEILINRHTPEIMIIERIFFNTNVRTAMSVGQARGVSLLLAAKNKLRVVEYTALEAKSVVSGYGRSSKKEMQVAVKDYMKLDAIIKPDDANDALALVLCFINKDY